MTEIVLNEKNIKNIKKSEKRIKYVNDRLKSLEQELYSLREELSSLLEKSKAAKERRESFKLLVGTRSLTQEEARIYLSDCHFNPTIKKLFNEKILHCRYPRNEKQLSKMRMTGKCGYYRLFNNLLYIAEKNLVKNGISGNNNIEKYNDEVFYEVFMEKKSKRLDYLEKLFPPPIK
jgi:hypothetical protein